MLTHGSLFSGIGGFDLGFERVGIQTIWQVENDPYAVKVLERHWPDVKRYGDIKAIRWEEVETPDIVSGGFPCQPVSVAGKRRGQDDDRWLWPEFARCLRVLRPRYAVLENVPGLLALGFGDVLGDLAALGYDAEWDCIPAAAFGAPHLRYRVWVVAYADGSGRKGRAGMFGTGRRGKPENGGQRIFPNTFSSKRFKGRERQRTSSLSVSEYWTTEPDVGRVVARLSSQLDGGGLIAHESCKQKACTAGIPPTAALSKMRFNEEGPAAPSELSGCIICGIPMSEMPYHRREEKWELGTWEEKSEGMCYLRQGVYELYAFKSQNLQPGMSIGTWTHQCFQTVENRVNRLKCLGNAIVPQIATWLGRRIIEFDK